MKTYKIYDATDRITTNVKGIKVGFENDGNNIVIRNDSEIVAIFPHYVFVTTEPDKADQK